MKMLEADHYFTYVVRIRLNGLNYDITSGHDLIRPMVDYRPHAHSQGVSYDTCEEGGTVFSSRKVRFR